MVWFWRDRAQVEQGIGGRRNAKAQVFFNMPCISEHTPKQNIHLDPFRLGQGKEAVYTSDQHVLHC